jgi:hypothetical protein
MSDQIKLDDCPEILRDAVKDELAKVSEYDHNAKIISCTKYNSINVVSDTTYKAYISNLNTFIILTYIETPPDHFKFGIMKDLVTIGEIKEIIRSAPEYFKY